MVEFMYVLVTLEPFFVSFFEKHSISDMTITIVEKIYNKNPLFLREKEKFYMKLFNTRLEGLNINS